MHRGEPVLTFGAEVFFSFFFNADPANRHSQNSFYKFNLKSTGHEKNPLLLIFYSYIIKKKKNKFQSCCIVRAGLITIIPFTACRVAREWVLRLLDASFVILFSLFF